MKVYVFEVEDWERQTFECLQGELRIEFVAEPLSRESAESYADAEALSPFIYSDLSADVLKHMDRLKLITTRSTGFEHIDLEYCEANNIIVCNVPVYGDNTVAEHVFALLLTISHKMIAAVDRTRRGDFSLKGLQGFDLLGKTLGVIGTGSIGRCVIGIAKGFRMDVLASDVRPDQELASQMGFRYVEMDQLLTSSDIITLHVPSNEKTRNLISDQEFARMKEGVVLINTARGDVLDIKALAKAIGDGKVAAAGLDVLPEEGGIREESELLRSVYDKKHDLETMLLNHILLRLRNVIITPHSAFNTREAVERILSTTVGNIISFTEGEPENVISGKRA
ncbi:MAG: hydroxyacid dehydrogenase [Syntrophus sp. (in: bacteria)]|nr:hydroxyacid dehydrogenase [Syntrophus sp. (in: bacteria)]